jgi:hypothetical protein
MTRFSHGILRCSVVLLLFTAAHSVVAQTSVASEYSEVVIDHQAYKVTARVVLSPDDTAQTPKDEGCVITKISRDSKSGCRVPAGRIGDGGVGCIRRLSTPSESVTKTFARIPGERSPSLFSAITRIDLSQDGKGGVVEVALFNFCGGWIFVPISPTPKLGAADSLTLRRISLQLSKTMKSEAFLYGSPEVPGSYRVLGLNQSVVILVPFTWSSDADRSTQGRDGNHVQMDAMYDSGFYSSSDKTYNVNSREYRVPSTPTPN